MFSPLVTKFSLAFGQERKHWLCSQNITNGYRREDPQEWCAHPSPPKKHVLLSIFLDIVSVFAPSHHRCEAVMLWV